MKKKKRRSQVRLNRNTLIIGVVVIVVFALLIHFIFGRNNNSAGIEYLEKQQSLKIEEISDELATKKSKERKQAVEEGKIDVFALLDDYVFYGDSRVMGFKAYGFLEEGRVFAESGNKLTDVDQWKDELEQYNPSNVIISYGANDLIMGFDGQEGGYDGLVTEKMNLILQSVPNAKIYLCAIIPTTKNAIKNQPALGDVDTYNNKLKKACDALDACTYIDTDVLAEGGNAEIYQDDGIHFFAEFYTDWLQYILDYME